MKLPAFVVASFVVLLAIVGCEDSNSTSLPIEKSALDKYVQENPVEPVTADDFAEVEAVDK